MNSTTLNTKPAQTSLVFRYFLWVFTLSVPFWLLGFFDNAVRQAILINLPLSSLMVVCPLLAAIILSYQQMGSAGVKTLLSKAFDYRNIVNKVWYLPVLFLMPFIMLLSYVFMRLSNMPMPEPIIPFAVLPILTLTFFIAAICEELGWQGYAFEPMQARWGALNASLILGLAWTLWHLLPFLQLENSLSWVLWQSLLLIALRVLTVWLYNNAGKSVFVAIVFHAMCNVAFYAFPNLGSHYNPLVTLVISSILVLMVIYLWGAKTLAHYRCGAQL